MDEPKVSGDSLVALGTVLLGLGTAFLTGAFYGPLAGFGAGAAVLGALLYLTGAVASWRGR